MQVYAGLCCPGGGGPYKVLHRGVRERTRVFQTSSGISVKTFYDKQSTEDDSNPHTPLVASTVADRNVQLSLASVSVEIVFANIL